MALPAKIKWFGFLLIVGPLLLILCGQVLIERSFSAQYLEDLLEDEIRADVEVGRVKLSLWSQELSLLGVSLHPRGKADLGTEVLVAEIRLGVKFWPLLLRRIESTSFVISEPVVRMVLGEEGDLSLEDLFRKPYEKNEEEDKDDEEVKRGKTPEEDSALDARESVWLTKVEEARIEQGRVELLLVKENLTVGIKDFSLTVTDLQFDPEDLTTLNHIQLELSGLVDLHDGERTRLLHLELAGAGEGKLFDERSGDFDADIVSDLSLGERSYLNPQIAIVRKVQTYLDRVSDLGGALDQLPEEIGFGRGHRLITRYYDDTLIFQNPLEIAVAGWGTRVAVDSWIALDNGEHVIEMEVLLGHHVDSAVSGLVDVLPDRIRSLAVDQLFDGGSPALRLTSTGRLKSPDIQLQNPLLEKDDLEDVIEKEVNHLKEGAEDFLKSLFRR